MVKSKKKENSLIDDSPVVDPKKDRLGRKGFAESIAKALAQTRIQNGFVVAIQGAWGSGKTSIINFALHYLDKMEKRPIVIRFNPWWFSEGDDLLFQFLKEFRAGLNLLDEGARLDKLAQALSVFSKALVPLKLIPGVAAFVAPVEEVTRATSAHVESLSGIWSKDVYSHKQALDKALRALDRPIIVVIDDLDRLTKPETYQMFRLLKAAINFSNTIYLLSFDKGAVVANLEGTVGERAEEFLEKIVQVHFDLPPASKTVLRTLMDERLTPLAGITPAEMFEANRWGTLFFSGIEHFIRTLRDVNRFTNGVQLMYPAVNGNVNFADFMAMEALRTFVPQVYYFVRDNSDLFTGHTTHRSSNRSDEPTLKEMLVEVMEGEIDDKRTREKVIEILKLLFPKVEQAFGGGGHGADWLREWNRKARVCSPKIFDVYGRFAIDEGSLSNTTMKALLGMASRYPARFETQVMKLTKQRGPNGVSSSAKDFLERVQDFTEEVIKPEEMEPLLKALYNIADRLPDDNHDFMDIENSYRVVGITYQLLKRVPEKEKRCGTLMRLIKTGKSPFVAGRFVRLVGADLGKFGEKDPKPESEWFVTADQFDRLSAALLQKIEQLSRKSDFFAHPNLRGLLVFWQMFSGDERVTNFLQKKTRKNNVLAKVLLACIHESKSVNGGDAVIKVTKYVPLDFVKGLFGDAAHLEGPVAKILLSQPRWLKPQLHEALTLFMEALKNPKQGMPGFLNR